MKPRYETFDRITLAAGAWGVAVAAVEVWLGNYIWAGLFALAGVSTWALVVLTVRTRAKSDALEREINRRSLEILGLSDHWQNKERH